MKLKRISPERKRAFLQILSETCNIGKAAEAIGADRGQVFYWKREDPEFAAAWEEAIRHGITALEDEAHRRGFEGYQEPVFYQGQEVGAIRKYSDGLAMFLLKAHAPKKYRETIRNELTGADGAPLQLDDTQRAHRIAAILEAARQRALANQPDGQETE